MKKLFSIPLALAMMLSCCACGKTEAPETETSAAQAQTEAPAVKNRQYIPRIRKDTGYFSSYSSLYSVYCVIYCNQQPPLPGRSADMAAETEKTARTEVMDIFEMTGSSDNEVNG